MNRGVKNSDGSSNFEKKYVVADSMKKAEQKANKTSYGQVNAVIPVGF